MLVGVTGNIGCGKTTFCRILKAKGFTVLNADEISKEILQSEAKEEVVLRFGREILTENGAIDTKKLASLVFSSSEKLTLLTEILHPMVEERILKLRERSEVFFLEAAVLIEANWQRLVDVVVLVFAYKGQRLLRAAKRFGLKEAVRRDSFQMPYAEKLKYADYLICNTGTLLDLKEQTLSFLEEFK